MSDSTNAKPPAGSICHVEIPAPNLSLAIAFYQAAFGWSVQRFDAQGFALFDDGAVGGGFDPEAEPNRTGACVYLRVEDIDAALARVEEAGGKTLKPKTEIGGEFGFYAHFADPNGNRMGL